MGRGMKVGKILGIIITVDLSWIFIFVLVTWNLAWFVFPAMHPSWDPGLNIALGILAALLFFLSVLLHELAHSVVAKALGLPVHRITLFIFGGVSNIDRELPSPATEFLMAIIGPITSILLGLGFTWLGSQSLSSLPSLLNNPMPLLRSLDPISTMLLWLGPINLLIGVFNLIPGFPMDGGRVMQSVLWVATGNLRLATRWATIVGQVFGWFVGMAGIAMIFGVNIPFLGTGIFSGLWLVFIGFFLINAASQNYQRVVIKDLLEGIPISRMIQEPPPAVPPDLSIHSLVYDYLIPKGENAYPVMDGEKLLGIVYAKNFLNTTRSSWETTPIKEVMVPKAELDAVAPHDDAMVAFRKMALKEVHQVPVLQNGVFVGILRRADLVRWLQLQSEAVKD